MNRDHGVISDLIRNRPDFPKRAIVTAGMPYGNKELHLGHVGGVFIHADTYARFLRDRIGNENVLFVSGTDCYGSPILENYRQLTDSGQFDGTITDFVQMNHDRQKEVLDRYGISLDLFAASALGRAAEIHREFTDTFIRRLYENGHLTALTTSQFFDTEYNVLLNGRQVVGQCPIDGCASEKAYADECSLGHQYMPIELINPKSVLSGKTPVTKNVVNWYFKLDSFFERLEKWIESAEDRARFRKFALSSMREFLEPPVIYVKKDQLDILAACKRKLPAFEMREDKNKSSAVLVFKSLREREEACQTLAENAIRYRTGKTLVPFRLTGNIEWGVPAPSLEGLDGLTVWVWPESLWAPISFTKCVLEQHGEDPDAWKQWWCSKDAGVFQFIGEDNVYFYGPAEMAMFMGSQSSNPTSEPKEGELLLPDLIVNNHLLFLNKKASSSGSIKAPTARELLDYYTPEQLRSHFLGLGLGIRSVSFQPKPFNPNAGESDSDPVLKEGSLLTNVFNRAVRSCFYTVQKYYDSRIPICEIGKDVLDESIKTILAYEKLMHKCDFHLVMSLMDTYIRGVNKYWVKMIRMADETDDSALRAQTLADTFHMIRTAAVLMHPIAPEGTEMILDYLNLDATFWHWDRIFDTLYDFMDDPAKHKLKFLEPRIDFFKKHKSQLTVAGE